MKKKTRLTTILILAAVAAFAFTGCSSSKKTEINLTNYVTVSFSGTDGAGTATVHYSDSQAANAVAEAMGVDLTSSVSTEASIYMAVDDVNKSVTPNSGLSNRDVVTVSISMASDDWITDSMAKKVEFVGGSVDVTVEGLAEAVAEGEEESEEEGEDSEWTVTVDENGNQTSVYNRTIEDDEIIEFINEVIEAYPDMDWLSEKWSEYDELEAGIVLYIAEGWSVDSFYKNYSSYNVTEDEIVEFVNEVIDEYPDMDWLSEEWVDDKELENAIVVHIAGNYSVKHFYENYSSYSLSAETTE